jgi:hypothetical protein
MKLLYASTDDGLQLPIIDVTHPAFAIAISDEELRDRVARFLREPPPFARLPAFLRSLVLRFVLRRSRLAAGLRKSERGVLSSIDTYVFKLGAEQLPAEFGAIDRRIAASLPALAVRLRLQDMATLLADELAPRLDGHARPLHFIDVAGGTAMDALNALLLLRRARREIFDGRRVIVRVLDGDPRGPAFGRRALAQLRAPAAPLDGVDATLEHVDYDWSRPAALAAALEQARAAGAIAIASSEGGLFEYGSDDDILANLRVLAAAPDVAVVGSVTRADGPIHKLHAQRRAATHPRGLDAFRALVARAGFTVARAVERPFSDHVVLRSGS